MSNSISILWMSWNKSPDPLSNVLGYKRTKKKIDYKYECIRKVYQKDQKYTNHNNGICDGKFHEYLNGSTDFIMSPFDKEFPLSTCGIHFWVSNSIFECFTSYLLWINRNFDPFLFFKIVFCTFFTWGCLDIKSILIQLLTDVELKIHIKVYFLIQKFWKIARRNFSSQFEFKNK